MKNNSLQLIIAGFGGQGVLFAGKLLAHSAMLEDKHVTCFPSYGAEMRGGTANCSVIISSEMIGSPTISRADSLIALNEASLKRFEPAIKPHGLLVINTSLVKSITNRPDIEIIMIKATDTAKALGNSQSANMIMLGALIAWTETVNPTAILKALREIIPAHKKDIIRLNEKAFIKGLSAINH